MRPKLINPPLARMLAGRLLRANNSSTIVLSTPDVHACKEALICGFVGDQLRRRLVDIWLIHGLACLKAENPKLRKPQYDELDALLVEQG